MLFIQFWSQITVQFLLLGLATGSLYAIYALGVVLTYRASGVLNFAIGSLGAIAAYFFYSLRDDHHVNWVLALALALVLGALIGVAMHFLVMVLLRRVSVIAKLISTLALVTLSTGIIALIWGDQGGRSPTSILPTNPVKLTSQIAIPEERLILIGIVLASHGDPRPRLHADDFRPCDVRRRGEPPCRSLVGMVAERHRRWRTSWSRASSRGRRDPARADHRAAASPADARRPPGARSGDGRPLLVVLDHADRGARDRSRSPPSFRLLPDPHRRRLRLVSHSADRGSPTSCRCSIIVLFTALAATRGCSAARRWPGCHFRATAASNVPCSSSASAQRSPLITRVSAAWDDTS